MLIDKVFGNLTVYIAIDYVYVAVNKANPATVVAPLMSGSLAHQCATVHRPGLENWA